MFLQIFQEVKASVAGNTTDNLSYVSYGFDTLFTVTVGNY